MEDKGNMCYRCKNFNRYYVKGVRKFTRVKFGYCYEQAKTVGSGGYCELWKTNTRRRNVHSSVKYFINELLTELREIRKFVEEEINGSDETEEL